MTTVQKPAHHQLEVEIGEDAMDITSEFDHKPIMEEDIDIEFDLDGGHFKDGEDENMSEDASSLGDEENMMNHELHPGNDHEMVDEGQTPQFEGDVILVDDEDLVDAEVEFSHMSSTSRQVSEAKDEALNPVLNPEDYESIPPSRNTNESNNVYKDTEPQSSNTFNQDSSIHQDKTKVTISNIDNDDGPDSNTLPYDPEVSIEDVLGDDEDALKNDGDYEANDNSLDDQDKWPVETLTRAKETDPSEITDTRRSFPRRSPLADHEGNGEDGQTSAFGNILTVEAQPDDLPLTAADSCEPMSIHPVTVLYQRSEISLFPPDEQGVEQTYFLKDQSLVNQSIADILGACKLVLAESIGEQDELEMRFESLNLDFCETTAESTTTSLADILELYLQLQENDGVERPAPFYITLTTKLRLAQRLEYLYTAAADGKGLTHVAQSMYLDEVENLNDPIGDLSNPDLEDAIANDIVETATDSLESGQKTNREGGGSVHRSEDNVTAHKARDEDQKSPDTPGRDKKHNDTASEYLLAENGFSENGNEELHGSQTVVRQMQEGHQLDNKGQAEALPHEASHNEGYFEDDEFHESVSDLDYYPRDEQRSNQNTEQPSIKENGVDNSDAEDYLQPYSADYSNTDRAEYPDVDDYEEGRSLQASAALAFTLQDNKSKVIVSGVRENVDTKVSDLLYEDSTVPAKHESAISYAFTSEAIKIDSSMKDGNYGGEVEHQRPRSSVGNVLDEEDKSPGATELDRLPESQDDRNPAVTDANNPHASDETVHDDDDDEITYSDDDDESLNINTSQNEKNEENTDDKDTTGLSSPSLKRSRADSESETVSGDQYTDTKRARSNQK